jgi:hypothetical protein
MDGCFNGPVMFQGLDIDEHLQYELQRSVTELQEEYKLAEQHF